jgi:N-acetylglucosamine kinase-like BadF-type ATPase
MIVIADSGSTKTKWAFAQSAEIINIIETEGINPYFISEIDLKILKQEVLKYEFIDQVFFYGAGCSNEEKKNLIFELLKNIFPNSKIIIESDLLGAARAIYKNDKGWIGILGTGSNFGFYDSVNIIKYRPSLGYIIGDEGSGAHIGKELLKSVFYKTIDNDIIQHFYSTYNKDINNLLSDCYSNQRPSRFLAQFTDFVYNYKENDSINSLLLHCFDEFFKFHIIPFYNYNEDVAFVGSVAYYFRDQLLKVAEKYNIKIKRITKEPITDLANYHLITLHK